MTLDEYIDFIRGKSIAVLGIGISNLPLIELLCREKCNVTACDRRTMEQLGEVGEHLHTLGAKLRLGEDYLENLNEDLIFRTPGLMPFDEHLERARGKGSIVTSEMEVFFALCPCRIFAVTGSDGKTTTTTLISEILKKAGYCVHLGGNIGTPLLCKLPEMQPTDLVVLELSSFQLHSMTCRPHTAVITNLSPNHLDKHKDFQDYMDAKSWIFRNQHPEDRLILNAADPHTSYYAGQAKSTISLFSDSVPIDNGCASENGVISFFKNGNRTRIMNTDEIRIPGQHNVQNMLAAFEAVREFAPIETCREVAMTFSGVPHRLEEIRKLHGITFINDSIASSPTRTIACLHALKTKPIVIAGGYDKHLSFDLLGEEFCNLAKAVILTGDTSDQIASAIEKAQKDVVSDSCLPVYRSSDLKEAVLTAYSIAEPGDTVVLSPACASFDRFRNFEERGNRFRQYVMDLES